LISGTWNAILNFIAFLSGCNNFKWVVKTREKMCHMASGVPAALLKQLSAVSESLNEATNQFNQQVNSIEDALSSYNLGVSASAHVCHIDHDEYDDSGNIIEVHTQDITLYYGKWVGKWCLQVRSYFRDSDTFEEWPMRDAPRNLRLKVIDGIPKLLEALIGEATKLAAEVSAKTVEARELAECIQPKKGQ
jgi:hypothetical protein